MKIIKKIKDKIFNNNKELQITNDNDELYMYIELGTLKDDPEKRKVIATNKIDIENLEPNIIIWHKDKFYYYDGENFSELKFRESRLECATEFHYYSKQDLTKSFLKSVSPGQLLSLTEPSYCIYVCVLYNGEIHYSLVEGDGELEIFIDDIKED